MGKRKLEKVEQEDLVVQEHANLVSIIACEEDEGEASSKSGDEENLCLGEIDEEEFSSEAEYDEFADDKFSDGEEGGDPVIRDEEEGLPEQDAQGPTAFSRAFGKIMKKRVPESATTEILGPVLAERKQLLVQKFEEAEVETKAKNSNKEEKRELREKGHSLPVFYTDAKEKVLMKLATKGVVRLFNAVSKAQTVQADADISSSKAAKATLKQSKAAFRTKLRGSKSEPKANKAKQNPAPVANEAEHEWAALRTDFMLRSSTKFIDWDKGMGDSKLAAESM